MSPQMMKSASKLAKSTPFEKFIFGIGSVGALLCWTFTATYVTMYYTDSVGLAAGTAGTILLVARIFDGISDIICAWVFKKVRFKLGQIRPWFMIAAPMLTLALLLVFNVPQGLSDGGLVAYITITYSYLAAVAYTVFNLAFSSIQPLMSYDPKDRANVISVGYFIMYIGIFGINYFTPLLLGLWGGEASSVAWHNISIIYCILCGILVFCMGVFIKEKTPPAEEMTENGEMLPHISYGKTLKIVLKNKWIWVLLIIFISRYFADGVNGISTYFWRDVMGSFSLISTASLITTVVTLIGVLVGPRVFNLIGKSNAMAIGALINLVGNLLLCIYHGNIMGTLVVFAIREFGASFIIVGVYLLIADMVTYINRKYHIQSVETVSMASSIGTKVGTGVGAAAVGWGLQLVGYQASAVQQTVGTQNGITLIMYGIPVVMCAIQVILLKIWPFDDISGETAEEEANDLENLEAKEITGK